MKRLLIVVDMQNDFITGSLGSIQAEKIVPNVKAKIEEYKKNGDDIIFTRDTHFDDYLSTQESIYMPVIHCIIGTEGHELSGEMDTEGCRVLDKYTIGSLELAKEVADGDYDEIELCGLCTDVCVISNTLIHKAQLPEIKVTVDARCCAGSSEENNKAAFMTMIMCQVNVTNF